MTREAVTLEPDLGTWLLRDHDPIAGWAPEPALEELRCHPDLVERLSQIARPVRGTARLFVAGRPVIHHPLGRPIAAASGRSWLVVRSDRPAGAIASTSWTTIGLGPEWLDLDPWSSDAAFAKGTDLLRGHVVRAFELAEQAATA